MTATLLLEEVHGDFHFGCDEVYLLAGNPGRIGYVRPPLHCVLHVVGAFRASARRIEPSNLANARCANDEPARIPDRQTRAWSDEPGDKPRCSGTRTVQGDVHGLWAVHWVATQKYLTSFARFEQILTVNRLNGEVCTGGHPIQVHSLFDRK